MKDAVEGSSTVTVVGYLKQDAELIIEDRHLGLRVAFEGHKTDLYDKLGKAALETVDLDKIEELATQYGDYVYENMKSNVPDGQASRSTQSIKIGMAYDSAFYFYYQENINALRDQGAELVFFSTLADSEVPAVDLLYLGGGYPELHAKDLSDNVSMCRSIKEFAMRGGAIYAECGGLMYLMDSIQDFEGKHFSMVGVFPFIAKMSRSHMMIGYRHLEVVEPCMLGPRGLKAKGHEFHYSTLVPLDQGKQGHYVCRMTDATCSREGVDGLVYKNTLALYSHIHFGSQPLLAKNLVDSASQATLSSHS